VQDQDEDSGYLNGTESSDPDSGDSAAVGMLIAIDEQDRPTDTDRPLEMVDSERHPLEATSEGLEVIERRLSEIVIELASEAITEEQAKMSRKSAQNMAETDLTDAMIKLMRNPTLDIQFGEVSFEDLVKQDVKQDIRQDIKREIEPDSMQDINSNEMEAKEQTPRPTCLPRESCQKSNKPTLKDYLSDGLQEAKEAAHVSLPSQRHAEQVAERSVWAGCGTKDRIVVGVKTSEEPVNSTSMSDKMAATRTTVSTSTGTIIVKDVENELESRKVKKTSKKQEEEWTQVAGSRRARRDGSAAIAPPPAQVTPPPMTVALIQPPKQKEKRKKATDKQESAQIMTPAVERIGGRLLGKPTGETVMAHQETKHSHPLANQAKDGALISTLNNSGSKKQKKRRQAGPASSEGKAAAKSAERQELGTGDQDVAKPPPRGPEELELVKEETRKNKSGTGGLPPLAEVRDLFFRDKEVEIIELTSDSKASDAEIKMADRIKDDNELRTAELATTAGTPSISQTVEVILLFINKIVQPRIL
jgi:hypothetical protein